VAKLVPTGAALAYSTFLGGSGFDLGLGIAVDGAGAAYVSGSTLGATDFPTTTGAFDQTHNGGEDAFVAKLVPTGAALDYSTFLGGSGFDRGLSIAVDGRGAAYVTGDTADADTDFPATPGAFDQTHNGGFVDAFVAKLVPTGAALAYSTFLGGSGFDQGFGIAVDRAGAAYVTGLTTATDFPTTAGAFDQTQNGDFDVFVTKLLPPGSAPSYSTFLGGSSLDLGLGIAVDQFRAAYVTGSTLATDFPTMAGAFDQTHNGLDDVYVTKLGPAGATLSYSTFLGGSSVDRGLGIAVDGNGAAYATGLTEDTTDFPTTAGAFDQSPNGGADVFVARLVEPTPPPPGPLPPGPSCRGLTTTHAGSDGDDTITGTPGGDVIAALAGNDLITALGGSDVVCAGLGHDTATGGRGKDTIQGEDGKDRLRGGSGDDRLSGGKGTDMCIGSSGQDVARKCEKEKSIP
jgi:hypothetical protein